MSMSSMLRQFSIRTRMIGAIAMVLALLLAVGGVGLTGMSSMRSQTQRFVDVASTEASQITRLAQQMGNLRRYEKDLLLNMGQADASRAARQNWDKSVSEVTAILKRLDGGGDDAARKVLRKLAPLVDSYANRAQAVLSKAESGGFDAVSAANAALADAKSSIQEAERLLDEVQVALDRDAKELQIQSAKTEDRMLMAFMVVLGISALIVVPLTLLNMHSICNPLAEAEALASAIAQGDLTNASGTIEGNDEASHLLRSLQHMQGALQGLVGQLRLSAEHIRTASVEIASGNQDLSSRTEQTASNLQQAASSMVQLTGTVKQTADSALTANQLASSASTAAAKGGEVVGQVVATMDEINTSSKKINDIISVIDGIAFQTNILALNAAVEAARAGEQGRGFAVVAGEVRMLAQRSAEAAREIKALIGASVDRVEAGTRLVQEAGSSMTEIVTSVQRVTDIIGEITAAASEQSEGIGQVNQSVVELDQMTQQNAALVEESAAAAESLKDQAEQLADAVDRFRINNNAAASSVKVSKSPKSSRPLAGAASATLAQAAAARAAAPMPAPVAKAVSPAPVKSSANRGGDQAPSAPRPRPPAAPVPSAAAEGDWESF
ncbi:methyl-accepting chemotaxis protein [Paucibacter sp. APW11]|uniref:Methyl-accepting chemotaxis protein n=1 Tax=Roseateles aquae TaxID=3077235 RepID=A0ABU3P9V4_9BURK|nr:methyl-accepting chemotaxis protein [Paucibacter sp. APW11]MDT8999369.1 methyl-accepting chemotaxis protein [Paucibacter sp. APW11]